jgi:hypothetical protein
MSYPPLRSIHLPWCAGQGRIMWHASCIDDGTGVLHKYFILPDSRGKSSGSTASTSRCWRPLWICTRSLGATDSVPAPITAVFLIPRSVMSVFRLWRVRRSTPRSDPSEVPARRSPAAGRPASYALLLLFLLRSLRRSPGTEWRGRRSRSRTRKQGGR